MITNMCESSGREWCRDDSTARRFLWWPGGALIFDSPSDLRCKGNKSPNVISSSVYRLENTDAKDLREELVSLLFAARRGFVRIFFVRKFIVLIVFNRGFIFGTHVRQWQRLDAGYLRVVEFSLSGDRGQRIQQTERTGIKLK